MLQEDPELFQLYKDLVVSGVVTADEFWSTRTNVRSCDTTTVPKFVSVMQLKKPKHAV